MIKHKAKKSLGQNFLKSEGILRQIVEAGNVKQTDIVLEIGPGKGALTEKLLENALKVVAVEKDRELFAFLGEKFAKEIENGKFELIEDDILEFLPENHNLKTKKFKIVANIPYNITGAILKKFLTSENQPENMTLLVQKEVAQRIVGHGSNPSTKLRVKESLLSISVKAYGNPKMMFKVPARFFKPAPKVDSAVIHISDISKAFFQKNHIKEEDFWEILRAGFAQKRKKLGNNLKKVCQGVPLAKYAHMRAEDLTLENWAEIVQSKNKF